MLCHSASGYLPFLPAVNTIFNVLVLARAPHGLKVYSIQRPSKYNHLNMLRVAVVVEVTISEIGVIATMTQRAIHVALLHPSSPSFSVLSSA